MKTKSRRPKGREGTLSSLNAAIEAINLAKEVATAAPTKTALDSASVLLTVIKVG